MMTNEVTVRDDGSVRVLTINRPERRNALDTAAYNALADGIREAEADDAVRAIVVTGAGEHFCAGNDLADFTKPKSEKAEQGGAAGLLHALIDARKPVFGAIEGYAVGIGVTMLLHFDMVYAGDTAKFRIPFAPLGVAPEGGSSLLLPQAAGIKKAKEILMFGEVFSAYVAEEVGIATSVVEGGTALDYAVERAQMIAKLPTDAVQTAKRLVNSHNHDAVNQILPIEFAEFARLLQTDDTQALIKSMSAR